VDEVKLGSMLECFGDVKVFGYFGIDSGILFVSLVHYSMQVSASHRILTGKQCHIPAAGDESFSDVAGDRFPGPILSRGSSPSHR
jgi:hypothetical protein